VTTLFATVPAETPLLVGNPVLPGCDPDPTIYRGLPPAAVVRAAEPDYRSGCTAGVRNLSSRVRSKASRWVFPWRLR